jgi:hypothetical protein
MFILNREEDDEEMTSSPDASLRSNIYNDNDTESVSSDMEIASHVSSKINVSKITKPVTKCRHFTDNTAARELNYSSDVDTDVTSLSTSSTLASTTDRRMRLASKIIKRVSLIY